MSSLYCRDTVSLSICPATPGSGTAGNLKIKTEYLKVLAQWFTFPNHESWHFWAGRDLRSPGPVCWFNNLEKCPGQGQHRTRMYKEDSTQWLATPVHDSHGDTTCHTSLSPWDCSRLLRAGREAQVSSLRWHWFDWRCRGSHSEQGYSWAETSLKAVHELGWESCFWVH